MSASPSHKDNGEEANDADLVHPSAAPDHKPGSLDEHSNGSAGKQQTPGSASVIPEQQDPQRGAQQPTEDPAAAEDDNIMQGHPATQEQAQYETEVKEQDRWLPIANGSFRLFLMLRSYLHTCIICESLHSFVLCHPSCTPSP